MSTVYMNTLSDNIIWARISDQVALSICHPFVLCCEQEIGIKKKKDSIKSVSLLRSFKSTPPVTTYSTLEATK